MSRSRPSDWPPRVYDDDLAQGLRDMAGGLLEIPASSAKRHHFVPQLWLRQFGAVDNPLRLHRLDRATGRWLKEPIKTAASKHRLYGIRTDAGELDQRVEGFLAFIEGHAAEAFRGFAAADDPVLDERQAFPLSILLGLQLTRAPRLLEHVGSLVESGGLELMRAATDDVAFGELVRSVDGPEVTDQTIEEYRQAFVRALDRDAIRLENPTELAAASLIENVIEAGEFVAHADWCFLEADSSEFVLNDVGHARITSRQGLPVDDAIVFPLSPRRCLLVSPPSVADATRVSRRACSADATARVNLCTYAWADDFIYGRTQNVVTNVRADAKRRKHLVRPPSAGDHLVRATDVRTLDRRDRGM